MDEMAFYGNKNNVVLALEKSNEKEETKLRIKEEPTNVDAEQKPFVIHSESGDIRIPCVYSGLEANNKLENTNVQMNNKQMDHEIFCKLEQNSSVKTEANETDCKYIKSEAPFPNDYKDDVKSEFQDNDLTNITIRKEEINPEPSAMTESEEEDRKFENEEEFLSGDEFLSDNEGGEGNGNAASLNTDCLSSSEDEEDTIAASLNENLKQMVQFDNPVLGDIIDIYKNYDELWDISKLAKLCNEKREQLMEDMCNVITIKLNVKLTILELETLLKVIHKNFSKEKKRRLKYELEQKEFSSLLTNFYRSDFLENHQGPFRCLNCNAIIKQFQQFQEHTFKHETNTCDICGLVGKNKRSLKRHKRFKHHITLHICELCETSYADEKTLKYHRIIKHIPKCEICGKVYRKRENMKQHYRNIHFQRDEKALQCKICGKICRNLKGLHYHRKTHNDESYDCPICKRSFRQKTNVGRHIKYVHGNQRFPCLVCGVKVYSFPYDLKKHLKVCK